MNRILFLPLLVAGLAASNLARAEARLKVGDKAPALKVAKWVKGTPIKSFEKGKVYVVEFWATWCGPCKVTIPHLTELAKKYKGKASITGVSIWETEEGDNSTEYMDKVARFVKEQGAKMDYNVAVDGVNRVVAKTWMEAAGEGGIPTAFVVGKDTNIAWIGHPMDGLDEVLDQVVADKFNAKAYAQKREQAKAAQAKIQQQMRKVQELAQKGQFSEALAELDKIVAETPQLEKPTAIFRYNLLLRTDETAAYALARKLAEGDYKDNPQALNAIAWPIVDDTSNLKSPDYDTAIAIAERAAELTKSEDGMILDTLAYAHFKKGNIDKAIALQEKAVQLIEKMENVPDDAKKEIKERLEMFKKKKNEA